MADSPKGRKRTRAAPDDTPPASSDETLQDGLDEMRQRFVATFVAQCDSIRVLVDKMAALDHPRPVAALTQITHRLNGLAGTIGFPTISARASDLENLVAGASGPGSFDALAARDAVDAIRNAFAMDLAKASAVRGATIIWLKTVRRARNQDRALSRVRELVLAMPSPHRDDHAMVRRGLRALLSDEFPRCGVWEAAAAPQVELLRKTSGCRAARHHPARKSGPDSLGNSRLSAQAAGSRPERSQAKMQFAVRVLKAGAGGA